MHLDYIQAKITEISSADDKIMLLSYINSKLELCDYYLGILDNQKLSKKFIVPNSRSQLVGFKNQLNRLRDMVLKYKIPNDNLVVFYPNKYDG